jgi:uncharacterized protein YacL
MNNRPNFPEEIFVGKKGYSCRTDWQVNRWLFAATIVSCLADSVFRHAIEQWHIARRSIVASVPFFMILLWIRDVTRWIRGMDELHRRITLAAVLFAVTGTFFLVMLCHRLNAAGLFDAIFPTHARWDLGMVGDVVLLLTFFYFLGHTLFNRRYE